MNIHEYQAKELLKSYNIPVPKGEVITKIEDAEKAAWKIESNIAVVKAQIHAGGRGKAGGVKIAKSIDEIRDFSEELLGKNLVTHQTGPQGKEIKTLLIEEGCNIEKEYYLAITLDRETSRVTMIASEEGGTDIEEVAAKSPEKIFKEVIDPVVGLAEFQARRLCFNINIPSNVISDTVKIMMNLYKCFMEKDCTLTEINPLVVTAEEKVIALDAKLNFDENSLYRNKDILEYRDLDEEDEKEVEASEHGLSYISLDGNIGCMVNGAGLAMATMDIIKYYGGEPANFLDVGGGASEEKVTNAFKIILSDDRVKGIFVNIFGGIMKCDVIASGIVKAAKEVNLRVPLVVRLEGTNVSLGKEILDSSDINIVTAKSMDEGAKKVVELIK
ncbi:ADP-forming succinate--CoA ligase subunit beta [Caldisalinibacter kiritimatiensis]|uniref:Succinate--CoA ligase [ADP-forming] subunit beta n=1 Tax=Caldisalinibacter kiritimatiensis TaxID=1304284 RepID=R1CSA7_9FIRM|nr:ADP-forming succinate--CoA ligase subunit beta [Caldisalinibacter kiritimatiensis]EOC99588.1 Succinyl-CoA ligase [ADP-forming] beta chain [Caldisalinibacter kiritimatiensis]